MTRSPVHPHKEAATDTDRDIGPRRGRGERLAIIAGVLVTVLAIAGIAFVVTNDGDPAVTPDAPPSTPTAATAAPTTQPSQQAPADQAAAAAEARYREFLRVGDTVGANGFSRAAAYEAVAVSPELAVQQLSVRQSRAQGLRQAGQTRLASLEVSSVDLDPPAGGYPKVVLQACLDVSGVDVTDRSGLSVVTADREPRSKSTVTMYQYKEGTVGAEAGGWYVYEATAKNEPC